MSEHELTFSQPPAGQVELTALPGCLQQTLRDARLGLLRPEAPQ